MVATVSMEQLKTDTWCRFVDIRTHDKEWVNNRSKLLDINKTFPVAKIASVSKGPHSKTGQSENAGGLLDTVIKSKKSKVMISVNLCVVWSLYWCNWHC